jgi:2-C-methyl-D-erythritol 4-phosphate cytidylyltransferase
MADSRPERTAALIVAAGEGRRLGGQPKALIALDGKPMIQHVIGTVRAFSSQIIVGVRAADLEVVRDLLGDAATVIAGGPSRQDTVQRLLAQADREMVMIHDVARPFASPALYASVLQAAFEFGGAAPVLPASSSDSVAMAHENWLGEPLPRDRVVRIQTPYAYKRSSLLRAMQLAQEQNWEDTSVTSLLFRAGYRTRLVDGDPDNVKVTYPQDLVDARTRLEGTT